MSNIFRRHKLLIAISIVISLGTLFLFLSYRNLGLDSKRKAISITEQEVLKELHKLETQLEKDFDEAKKVSDSFATSIALNPQNAITISHELSKLFREYNFSAIGIHPSHTLSEEILKYDKTYQLDGNKHLWSPFSKTHRITPQTFPYDYTSPTTAGKYWYSENLKEGSWTSSYLGTANNAMVVSYRSPILSSKITSSKTNNGIVCLDYALGYIQHKVAELNLFRKGYGIIIDDNAVIISHPSDAFLGKHISEVFSKEEIEKIKALPEDKFSPIDAYRDRIVDRNLYFKHNLHITKGSKPIIYHAIIVLNESETLSAFIDNKKNPLEVVKYIRFTIICGITLMISLFFYWLFVLRYIRRLWPFITLQTLTFIVGMLATIYTQLKTPVYTFSKTDIEITNKTGLNAYLNALKRKDNSKNLLAVKTGFYIQNLKFSSANDLSVIGYFWMKIDNSLLNLIRTDNKPLEEVLEPEFPEAENLDLDLETSMDGYLKWHFSAEIRQSFNYSNYPFDEEDIWLRVRPKGDLQDKIILVPDFDSYPKLYSQNDYYLDPNIAKEDLKAGLTEDLFIKGWKIIKTSFSLRDKRYTTSFGRSNFSTNEVYPELYFNISVKRRFLKVFVVYFIPILVTAFLLFTVLITFTKDSEKNELYEFSVSTVLAFTASLFFVIIVSHMSLREALQTGGLIYLEYYFFVLYLLITLVSIAAFLFSSNSEMGILDRQNGIYLKAIYWPLFCFIIFILTTLHFSIH